MEAKKSRSAFFRYLHDGDSLDAHVHRQIEIVLTQRRTELFDERNIHSYRHGDRWTMEPTSDETSDIQTMSAETTLHSADVIDHDISTMSRHIESMVDQLYGALMKHVYQTVGEAAEATGNTVTVDQHQGDLPTAFLTMLQRIEFGVDRYGRATHPSYHIPSSRRETVLKALASQPAEFHRRAAEISQEKEKEAVRKETERISRYRWKPR
jgi:hypothetical protein